MTLEEYAGEIGVEGLSLDQLIQSHKNLRTDFVKAQRVRDAELDLAREAGRKQGLESVTNGEYIESKRMLQMTVQELVNFLGKT